jgi:mRNA interferase RelE/StbE
MCWKIELKPTAAKSYQKLEPQLRVRIKASLADLQNTSDPLRAKGVKALVGNLKGDYRIRLGEWRALFTPHTKEGILYVYAILPRSKAYRS